MKTRLSIAVAMLVLPTLIIAPVFAQTPSAIPPPPAAQKLVPPKTLEEGLNAARWDASKHGVLIALDSQAPLNRLDVMKADASTLVQGRDGYEVDSLAAYFKRIVHRFGGVTVVAPVNMVVLNPRPGTPVDDREQGREKSIKRLLATFTVAQWRLAGGRNGIGFSDMRAAQQKLYDSILDNPFVVARMTYKAYYSRNWPGGKTAYDAATKRILTAEERAAIRFRVKNESTVHPYFEDNRETSAFAFGRPNDSPEPILVNVSAKEAGKEDAEKNGVPWMRKYTHGVDLATTVPNHLKPSDLKYGSLTRTVSLETAPEKPLTVGMLIAQIAQANQLSLICDPRIKDVPVWVRGASAGSGDLLKAICLGVSGTVRRVGDTYLLTSDVEGLAVRRAVVDDWYVRAIQSERDENERIDTALSRTNPVQYILLDENDPIKPPPALMEQRLAKMDYRNGIHGVVMKRSEFSPEAIAYLDHGEKQLQSAEDRKLPSRTTSYVVSLASWWGLIVPGIGEIEGEVLLVNLSPFPPPPSLQAAGKQLLLRPTTVGEAQLAVEGAVKRGAKGVWILTTMTPAGETILQAAITAGQSLKLPVYAVVHLMKANTTNAPADLLDRNIRGETSDWLAPDLPQTKVLLTNALSRLAKTPYLTGITLIDIAPPGYRGRTIRPPDGNPSPFATNTAYDEQGYRFGNRLKFLKEYSADPIDIVSYPFVQGTPVPFFTAEPFTPESAKDKTADQWAAWRNDRALPLINTLRQVIEDAHPGLPVLLQGGLVDYFMNANYFQWYTSWDAGEPLPHLFPSDIAQEKPLAPQVREKAKMFFVTQHDGRLKIPYPTDPTGADGVVLDLSADTIKGALDKLEKPKEVAAP